MSRGSLVTKLAAAVVATVLLSPESATPQAIVGLVKRTNVAATYVQGPAMNASTASGSTIQTAAFGSATTRGNTVICAINVDNSRTLSSVTDTAGNTYTQAVNAVATHLASANNAIYYKTNIVGGSTDAGNLDGDTMQYKIVTLMTPVTIDSTLSPADAYHLSYVTFKSN